MDVIKIEKSKPVVPSEAMSLHEALGYGGLKSIYYSLGRKGNSTANGSTGNAQGKYASASKTTSSSSSINKIKSSSDSWMLKSDDSAMKWDAQEIKITKSRYKKENFDTNKLNQFLDWAGSDVNAVGDNFYKFFTLSPAAFIVALIGLFMGTGWVSYLSAGLFGAAVFYTLIMAAQGYNKIKTIVDKLKLQVKSSGGLKSFIKKEIEIFKFERKKLKNLGNPFAMERLPYIEDEYHKTLSNIFKSKSSKLEGQWAAPGDAFNQESADEAEKRISSMQAYVGQSVKNRMFIAEKL